MHVYIATHLPLWKLQTNITEKERNDHRQKKKKEGKYKKYVSIFNCIQKLLAYVASTSKYKSYVCTNLGSFHA